MWKVENRFTDMSTLEEEYQMELNGFNMARMVLAIALNIMMMRRRIILTIEDG